jgi:hypothetical protein
MIHYKHLGIPKHFRVENTFGWSPTSTPQRTKDNWYTKFGEFSSEFKNK